MNIGDNMNSFRLKSELNEKKSQPKSSVGSVYSLNPLTYALGEVEINSPDSIALAVAMLKKHHIEIPELDLLNQLHMHIGARDVAFETRAHELQQKVMAAIKEIIQKKG